MFEKASRDKTRFNSVQGMLTTEQLWDLPLTTTRNNVASLNAIAVEIQTDINKSGNMTFVKSNGTSPEVADLKEKLAILVHIIGIRETENQAAIDEKAIKTKKAILQELISKKQGEELGNKTVEELQADLAALDK